MELAGVREELVNEETITYIPNTKAKRDGKTSFRQLPKGPAEAI